MQINHPIFFIFSRMLDQENGLTIGHSHLSSSEGLMVVGAGLMRTGTRSLQIALEHLIGKCYHAYNLTENHQHIEWWISACNQDRSEEEWKRFYAGYKAAVCFPTVAFYDSLMKIFPNAKVILTTRPPEAWFNSLRNTVCNFYESMSRIAASPKNCFNWKKRYFELMLLMHARVLGTGFDVQDKQQMIALYNQHEERVKQCVPEDRLLIFDASEGWEPLCKFLGAEVPDVPFPVTNTPNYYNRTFRA